MKDIARSMSLAVTISSCIVAGCAVGYYMDRWTGLRPLFMIVGLLIGVVMSFMALYRWAKRE